MLIIHHSSTHDLEINYTLRVLFHEWLGIDYKLSKVEGSDGITIKGDHDKFLKMPLTLLGNQNQSLSVPFMPKTPLRERELNDLNGSFSEDSVPVIFGESQESKINVDASEIHVDIDIISSIFFCLSRIEEIWTVKKDNHDRFPFQESLMYKAGIQHRAIVNEYLEILWSLLKMIAPDLQRKERRYTPMVSHDVDHPFLYQKGLYKNLKSLVGDIVLRRDLTLFSRHARSFFGGQKSRLVKDPFNSFNELMDVSEEHGIKSEFNFISNDENGGIDGDYDLASEEIKSMITEISQRGHIVGFHPGYYTYDDEARFNHEAERFRAVMNDLGIQQEIWGGRQHYLRWKNPTTWQLWEDTGFDYDSSMGVNDGVGFRSGTCYSHSVFNVETRTHLRLVERPLIFMDVNGERVEEDAEEVLKKLVKVVKRYDGEMTFLYHNNYLRTKKEKKKYTRMIKIIT